MSDISSALDQSVAAAKGNYARIDSGRLIGFLQHVFRADVVLREVGGGAAKSGSSSGILVFSAGIVRQGGTEEKKLVLRYDPQADNRIFYRYDLDTEYQLLEKLQNAPVKVPRVHGLDASGEMLGVSGFLMECAPGAPIPTSLFNSGPLVEATPPERREIYLDILRNLAAVHTLDYAAYGLSGFSKQADGACPPEKFINWWRKTWDWARPDDYERLLPIHEWLLANAPVIRQPVLMHGDPNLGNYLLHNNRVSAMLDWELSSVGAAELDLAIQIVSMDPHRPHTSTLPVVPPTEADWLSMYADVGGKPIGDLRYYKVHAAYEILICMGSMSRYLPEAVASQYKAMSAFYWDMAQRIMRC
ncbi:phosphotransferase enzyme family protein [Hyphomonas polymorpha PS728]|uniref:Phosphotransferase enzyme family protein n=1 Tax=Hyphomonas polymorpha PS728 TaxID=1280954 RepID=A0A062VDV6_9PROT|nr:phosphotransferase family protein [Hyphomonas polymorpha]KCZ97620.1 phosphotransferase enzyme family protein [Hyphomonas polymorpha PS728]